MHVTDSAFYLLWNGKITFFSAVSEVHQRILSKHSTAVQLDKDEPTGFSQK